MSQKNFIKVFMVLGVMGFFGTTLSFAGYGKKDKAAAPAQQAAAPVAPAATAAPEADKAAGMAMNDEMMAKWKDYATPNENHKALEPLVGNWTYTFKMWMSPEAPAEETTGTSETKWIMDGRFIEETSQGTSMGQPFHGRQVTGFDNAQKQYISTWIDNMGTGMMSGMGTYDPATKTLTETGTFICPIKGKMPLRWVTKITDENNHTFEGYTNDDQGKEFKNMEIVYKKADAPKAEQLP